MRDSTGLGKVIVKIIKGEVNLSEIIFIIGCMLWMLISLKQLNMARLSDRIEFGFTKYYKRKNPIMFRLAVVVNGLTVFVLAGFIAVAFSYLLTE